MLHINPVVDLGNAVSLKYTLPMGAHDLGGSSEDWTWRQSEHGKITPESTDIFFPIDGFTDFNREQVLAARDELQALVKTIFGCEAVIGFVDADHPEMEL